MIRSNRGRGCHSLHAEGKQVTQSIALVFGVVLILQTVVMCTANYEENQHDHTDAAALKDANVTVNVEDHDFVDGHLDSNITRTKRSPRIPFRSILNGFKHRGYSKSSLDNIPNRNIPRNNGLDQKYKKPNRNPFDRLEEPSWSGGPTGNTNIRKETQNGQFVTKNKRKRWNRKRFDDSPDFQKSSVNDKTFTGRKQRGWQSRKHLAKGTNTGKLNANDLAETARSLPKVNSWQFGLINALKAVGWLVYVLLAAMILALSFVAKLLLSILQNTVQKSSDNEFEMIEVKRGRH